jgi:glutamate 5-kinase
MAGGAGSSIGRGGMLTKVLAAKRAARSGASTVIAWGREPDVLLRLAAGEAIGTALVAGTPKLAARKQWMADHLQLRGAVGRRWCGEQGARRRQEPAADRRDRGAGRFRRGDVIAVRTGGRRDRTRPGELLSGRGATHRPQAFGADREPAGLCQRARDDPPRQPGAGLAPEPVS